MPKLCLGLWRDTFRYLQHVAVEALNPSGNEGAVWEDFQKLLAARAKERIMIKEEKGSELKSWLGRQIEGFVSVK